MAMIHGGRIFESNLVTWAVHKVKEPVIVTGATKETSKTF